MGPTIPVLREAVRCGSRWGNRPVTPGPVGSHRRPVLRAGSVAGRPGRVSGANQYRVKPWPLVSTVVPPIVVVFITAPVWHAGGLAARTRHCHAEQHQGHDGHASDRRRGALARDAV